MNQPIQCTDEDLQELKRLALAVRANSDDDDALGVALDEYDEHANPDQVLCLFEAIDRVTADADRLRAELECSRGDFAQLERISDALQQRLTAADERADVLETALRKIKARLDAYAEADMRMPESSVEVSQVIADAALKPAARTNTSGNAHCSHDGICHTSDETCAEARARIDSLKPAEGGDDTTLEEDREDFKKVFVRTNTKQGQNISLADMMARYEPKP